MSKLEQRKDNIDNPTLKIKQNRKITKASTPTEEILELLESNLDENKAEDITVINLIGKSDIAEYMIIATGRSDRHIRSCAEHLCDALKAQNIYFSTEGMDHKNWVLVDTIAVIVHIFNKETRDAYNLEDLWQ